LSEYDTAGRLSGIRNGANYYVGGAPSDATNRIQYTAHGAVASMLLGNGRYEHTSFNSRLQPTQIGLGTTATDSSLLRLDYSYGTSDNNGNVQTQRLVLAALDVTQTYTYDTAGRFSRSSASQIGCHTDLHLRRRWATPTKSAKAFLMKIPSHVGFI
jgi:hypothetical protein